MKFFKPLRFLLVVNIIKNYLDLKMNLKSNICSLPLKPQNRIFIIEIYQKYLVEHSLIKQNCVEAKNFSYFY